MNAFQAPVCVDSEGQMDMSYDILAGTSIALNLSIAQHQKVL